MAPSASARNSRGLACEETPAAAVRMTRTLAPGILSLARLTMSYRIWQPAIGPFGGGFRLRPGDDVGLELLELLARDEVLLQQRGELGELIRYRRPSGRGEP